VSGFGALPFGRGRFLSPITHITVIIIGQNSIYSGNISWDYFGDRDRAGCNSRSRRGRIRLAGGQLLCGRDEFSEGRTNSVFGRHGTDCNRHGRIPGFLDSVGSFHHGWIFGAGRPGGRAWVEIDALA